MSLMNSQSSRAHGEVLCSCKASNHEGVALSHRGATSWFEAALRSAPHHEVYLLCRGIQNV